MKYRWWPVFSRRRNNSSLSVAREMHRRYPKTVWSYFLMMRCALNGIKKRKEKKGGAVREKKRLRIFSKSWRLFNEKCARWKINAVVLRDILPHMTRANAKITHLKSVKLIRAARHFIITDLNTTADLLFTTWRWIDIFCSGVFLHPTPCVSEFREERAAEIRCKAPGTLLLNYSELTHSRNSIYFPVPHRWKIAWRVLSRWQECNFLFNALKKSDNLSCPSIEAISFAVFKLEISQRLCLHKQNINTYSLEICEYS